MTAFISLGSLVTDNFILSRNQKFYSINKKTHEKILYHIKKTIIAAYIGERMKVPRTQKVLQYIASQTFNPKNDYSKSLIPVASCRSIATCN